MEVINGFDLIIYKIRKADSIKFRQIITTIDTKDGIIKEQLDDGEYIDICHTLTGELGIDTKLII